MIIKNNKKQCQKASGVFGKGKQCACKMGPQSAREAAFSPDLVIKIPTT